MTKTLLIFLLLWASWARASVVEHLEAVEDRVSGHVQRVSHIIDTLFSRDDTEVEQSGTRFKVSFITRFEEYENPSYNFAASAKLMLPKTKERLHLLILSDEEGLYRRHENDMPTPDDDVNESVGNQRYRLGLRQLFHSSRTSAVALDGGVKIRFPLDPFVRLLGRRSWFFDKYEFRVVDKLYWFESEGWATTVSIDLDRPLDSRRLLRLSNNGDLDHESGLWEFNHFIALYHRWSSRTAVGYYAGINSNDEPTLALQRYYVATGWRYALLPEWLFLQIQPELFWAREHDWERRMALVVRLESIFGDTGS